MGDKSYTLFIFEKRDSFWKSCEVFNQSYLKITDSLLGKIDGGKIFFDAQALPSDFFSNLKEKLSQFTTVNLFVCSHLIDSSVLIEELTESERGRIRIVLPVFGDLTVEVKKWQEINKRLKGIRISFLYASPCYETLLKSCLEGGSFEFCPYPVSNDFLDTSLPESDSICLTYAGRVTLSKGILEILDLAQFIKKNKLNFKIKVVGNFFDRARHLHGYILDFDKFRDRVLKDIEELSPYIEYHEEVSQAELKKIFSETDYYICLGTYHDEDFGLSPVQAMGLGCGSVLSNWGGFRVLNPPNGSVKVPVKFDSKNFPVADSQEILKAVLKLKKLTNKERQQNTQYVLENFSEEVIEKKWLQILETQVQAFEGVSKTFEEYAKMFDTQHLRPFKKVAVSEESFEIYKKMYKGFYS